MSAQHLRNLLQDANESLVETGEFPASWLEAYRMELLQISNAYGDTYWPQDVFGSLHYISTHLCLRYFAHRGSKTIAVAETEEMLGHVHFETSLFFWTEVAKLPASMLESKLSDHEKELISLCFGKSSPVTEITEKSSFRPWEQSYNKCLDNLQEPLRHCTAWNKWMCVALHFAAFYVDYYQQRDLDLEENRNRSSNVTVLSLVDILAHRIENLRVLSLIELWLDLSSIERTPTGIPQFGKLRQRSDVLISVRTRTELFIQSHFS